MQNNKNNNQIELRETVNTKSKIRDEVNKLTSSLGLDNKLTDYIKDYDFNDNYKVSNLDNSIDLEQLNELNKNLEKISNEKVSSEFKNFLKNMVETRVLSLLDYDEKPQNVVKDIIRLVNNSLGQTNDNFEKKLGINDKISDNQIEDCPAQNINVNTQRCDKRGKRKVMLKLHPDKNLGCTDLAKEKFLDYTAVCEDNMEGGGILPNTRPLTESELLNLSNRISNALNFDSEFKGKLDGFLSALKMPEMIKSIDEIKDYIDSDNIDRRIAKFESDNLSQFGKNTAEKFKKFKSNIAKLELLTIIERWKKLAKEEQLEDESQKALLDLLEVVNKTLSRQNSDKKESLFKVDNTLKIKDANMQGGGFDFDSSIKNFKNYLKYLKYKKKYINLKLNNIV